MSDDAAPVERSGAVPQKAQHRTPHDPASALLGTDPKELEKVVKHNADLCSLSAVLCTMARRENQPKCLPAGECMNKMWESPP